jgi:hypothetical protein
MHPIHALTSDEGVTLAAWWDGAVLGFSGQTTFRISILNHRLNLGNHESMNAASSLLLAS